MRLKPLEQWVCDECGQMIDEAEDGWLEWKTYRSGGAKYGDFRIVHNTAGSPRYPYGDCYRRSYVFGSHLKRYCGLDGLARLLAMFQLVEKPDEIVEIIRRLHIPHYEEARLYWERAKEDGFFAGTSADAVWPYLPDTLKALIELYDR